MKKALMPADFVFERKGTYFEYMRVFACLWINKVQHLTSSWMICVQIHVRDQIKLNEAHVGPGPKRVLDGREEDT